MRRLSRWKRIPVLLFACCCVLTLAHGVPTAQTASSFVYVTTVEGDIVTPVLAQWIREIIKRSDADGAEALVIQLDTPGGLLEATHDIVKDILGSPVPVIVYVAPSGSRAASAGTFITLAGHVAAMAPATNIGAAHPVTLDGTSPDDEPAPSPEDRNWFRDFIKRTVEEEREESERQPEAGEEAPSPDGAQPAPETGQGVGAPGAGDEAAPGEPAEGSAEGAPGEREEQQTGTAMSDKILNDTIAWARTIANRRGRNAAWAEKAIVESSSLTEEEALAQNVIDVIAQDLDDLLAKADGRTVDLPKGGTQVLHTKGAEVRWFEMTFRYKFLGALAHPQILILLLSLGGLGLTMELFNPNGITGVIGAVCLILAYFGLQTLPINYAGILLMLLALVLIIAEIKVISYGLLTLGALVCFTLGGLMLIDSPDEILRVQLPDVLPVTLTVGVIAIFLLTLVIRSQRTRPMSGREGMVGLTGVVRKSIDPTGKVEVRGELWNATSAVPIPEGTRVRIAAMDGFTLAVEPLETGAAASPGEDAAAKGTV